MSKKDPYFRFPLAALTFDQPVVALGAFVCYGIVNAGEGARVTMKQAFFDFAIAEAERRSWTWPATPEEIKLFLDVAAGSALCNVVVRDWQATWRQYAAVESHVKKWCEAAADSEAFVTMKAEWVWRALNRARILTGGRLVAGHSRSSPQISWQEFRVLCAILSVIGKKPFAYISSSDIAHRACGYTSAAAWKKSGEQGSEHLPIITRWQIDKTLADLEKNRFFLRARVSRGNTGGRTAYSIRHASRKSLWQAMRTQRDRREGKDVIENRKEDQALQSEVYFQSLIS